MKLFYLLLIFNQKQSKNVNICLFWSSSKVILKKNKINKHKCKLLSKKFFEIYLKYI